mmetsp:Transcript_9719/g.11955  ORF Transcript_9719/g.11955 Transcript_9719/m.11955 type:complete len:129 (-) Transcript_9719:965-1351(-)|eukprot:CAMPEP_0170456538 /NCGR_PEP_ID=MMETSP0123-20130129/4136_1 /TAXON_ID=182087 /ORGANISM="Favella ehrenbergii, Strain Fehren 1" /LENGTH=128 /DNA_ID=CAMNT_0010720043 /DNA_START=465 /DNA_END=851 /DNA_ORIENTATION=-
MINPRDDPGLFELVVGKDHIEIVVKTVNLGDSETPTTTLNQSSMPGNATNRSANRNSLSRRGTVMMNTPFIPESPSQGQSTSNGHSAPLPLDASGRSSRSSVSGGSQNTSMFSFSGSAVNADNSTLLS